MQPLQMFIRELPIPIIPFEYYHDIINAAKNEEQLAEIFMKTLTTMPQCHKECLFLFLVHWSKVAAESEDNKMTVSNLAVVFAPNVLRAPADVEPAMCLLHTPR